MLRPETLPGFELRLGNVWPTKEELLFFEELDEQNADRQIIRPDEDP